MAPLGLLQRLRDYWPYGKSAEAPPPLTTRFAVILSICFTLLYVLPFYLSPLTRPSPTLSRDSPSVIKARVRSVFLSCALCALITVYVLSVHVHLPYQETLRLLGWWPISLPAITCPLLLTALLFAGPLFERLVVEEGWRDFLAVRPLFDALGSWTGWRNYVAGPATEELLFRSLLLPINLLSPQVLVAGLKGNHAKKVILTTPLFFGLAHIHHLYEFRITHPYVPWRFALAQSFLQLAYTTLFGWFAAFVFVRTGSLWAVILIHAFCNSMGLPRLWGRVERPLMSGLANVPVAMGPPKNEPPNGEAGERGFRARRGSYVRTRSDGASGGDQGEASIMWTVIYYALLVGGMVAFYRQFWHLTDTTSRLSDI